MGALETLLTDVLVDAGLDQSHIRARTALELPGYYRPDRTEEAIGNAEDIWTAYREGRFGRHQAPFLGYFFLLEDCARVHAPVGVAEPYFEVDPVFKGASYAKRYEVLRERLMLERKYSATCLTLATKGSPTAITSPAGTLTFRQFAAAAEAHARSFVNGSS